MGIVFDSLSFLRKIVAQAPQCGKLMRLFPILPKLPRVTPQKRFRAQKQEQAGRRRHKLNEFREN